MKRLLSLLLAFALLLAPIGCRREPDAARRTDLRFSELTESGENAGLVLAQAKELLFRIERGELAGERAQAALEEKTAALERLGSDAALLYVRYCLDVTNEANKAKYDALSVQCNAIECVLVDAALLLARDPSLADRYDAETVERLQRADALSDLSIRPLIERERALVGRYEALPNALRVSLFGREWTGDEILSDPTLSLDDFSALYEAYMERFHAEASAIYLELIAVRNEIARTLGFGSYAEYSYACFDRDYTPSEAERFSERVRAAAVPVFLRMRESYFPAAAVLLGKTYPQEPTMERIGAAIRSILPELKEPWDYMLSHGMLDLGANATRMPGSFTTYFSAYGAPFLFGEWTDGADMVSTIAHEFGHYASFFRNGVVNNGGTSLDLAEIDSQGLELLIVLRYDTLYGDLSEAAETAQIFHALYALIDGCAEDAFQRFAYACEGVTADDLDAAYARILGDFGLDALGLDPRSWTQIAHTFSSPFYYISYAAGMSAALELFLSGREHPEKAVSAYRAVLNRAPGARFRETLRQAGLCDPFLPDTIERILRGLDGARRYRKNE